MTPYGIAGDILDRLEAQMRGETGSGTNKKEYTRTVTLKFIREQLLYDIRNIAYVESDVMPGDNDHSRHQVADIGEDGNVDRVTRIMDLAFAAVTELLYPYTKSSVGEKEERTDEFKESEVYVIDLLVPDDFSKTTVDYLTRLIHEFVVYRVLADWMGIANLGNSESAANWEAKASSLADEIDSTLHARMRRVRRTLSPF
jgi:hypothetical protein